MLTRDRKNCSSITFSCALGGNAV